MNATDKQRIMPPPLQKGETIGLIAPAGPVVSAPDFEAGLRLLHDLGFQVKYQRDIKRTHGYLAGPDQQRAAELHDLWRDPEVKALLAVRGGYGCLRMVAGVDMELIRRHPKPLIGFSDITVLHAAILKYTDLVCFHGPMLTTLAKNDKSSVESFFHAVTGRLPPALKPAGLEVLVAGNARGPLLGGNLANLVHLVGTPYEPSWDSAILFLEEVGEAPYRVDRMLTHLKTAGRLDTISGLILGRFKDCGNTESIWQRAVELLADSSIPIWANFPVGHGTNNLTMPLGVPVRMAGSQGLLHFNC